MQSYLPQRALAFRDLFTRVEHTLKRIGYMRPNQKRAVADRQQFASDLGEAFFCVSAILVMQGLQSRAASRVSSRRRLATAQPDAYSERC
jgi:hypothetical protein